MMLSQLMVAGVRSSARLFQEAVIVPIVSVTELVNARPLLLEAFIAVPRGILILTPILQQRLIV